MLSWRRGRCLILQIISRKRGRGRCLAVWPRAGTRLAWQCGPGVSLPRTHAGRGARVSRGHRHAPAFCACARRSAVGTVRGKGRAVGRAVGRHRIQFRVARNLRIDGYLAHCASAYLYRIIRAQRSGGAGSTGPITTGFPVDQRPRSGVFCCLRAATVRRE